MKFKRGDVVWFMYYTILTGKWDIVCGECEYYVPLSKTWFVRSIWDMGQRYKFLSKSELSQTKKECLIKHLAGIK